MKKKTKMRLLGILLVIFGVSITIYSILFTPGNISFWIMYAGLIMIMTGLGLLGLDTGYPI